MQEKGRSIFEYALRFARLSFQCITVHFEHYSSVLAKAQWHQHTFIFMLEVQTKLLFSSTSQKLRIWECYWTKTNSDSIECHVHTVSLKKIEISVEILTCCIYFILFHYFWLTWYLRFLFKKSIFLMFSKTIYTLISVLLRFCNWFNFKWLFSIKKHLKWCHFKFQQYRVFKLVASFLFSMSLLVIFFISILQMQYRFILPHYRCLTTRSMQSSEMSVPVAQHVFLAKFLKKGICIFAVDILMSVFKCWFPWLKIFPPEKL